MLWEYVVLPIVTSIVYMLALSVLSEGYMSFLKSKGLRKGDALMVLIFAACVTILSFAVVKQYLYAGGNIWILLSFFIVMLLPILAGFRSIRKLRIVGSRKVMLDGEEIEYHVYSGSDVNAFYNLRGRKIYVHEALEELLSEDERKAILYHEHKHSVQASRRPHSVALNLAYVATAFWIFAGLVISALASYIVSSIFLFPGAVLSNVLAVVSALVAIYFILTLFSLIVVYLRWVWEHDADLYAAGKVGAEVFAKALVKVYLAKYLANAARYITLESLSADFKLGDIPPLTRRDVFKELIRQTLSPQGLVDTVSIVIKPLEETHPPLHLRLRAVRTTV